MFFKVLKNLLQERIASGYSILRRVWPESFLFYLIVGYARSLDKQGSENEVKLDSQGGNEKRREMNYRDDKAHDKRGNVKGYGIIFSLPWGFRLGGRVETRRKDSADLMGYKDIKMTSLGRGWG